MDDSCCGQESQGKGFLALLNLNTENFVKLVKPD